MKGIPEVIEMLQRLRASEATAYQLYIGQGAIAENWGLMGLAKRHYDRANDEKRHMGMLDARITFLEGTPAVSQINNVELGNAVPLQFSLAKASELQAIKDYRAGIARAEEARDYVTGGILREILKDEETDHLGEIEATEDQISMMGLAQYLPTLIEEED